MRIHIRQPLGYTHTGLKDNQEDRLYPVLGKATEESRFFILCDGMGGHEKGEVAANTVCEVMGKFIETHQPKDGIFTEELFDEALTAAYDALDNKDSGAFRKMGTTLAFIYLHRKGCFAAHIGDSRIYQIRPGHGLLYQSSDHSLVNDLLKAGEITPEEAINHPQKNMITRVMQPNAERRYMGEVHQLTDIQAGDYFFLCSDGVLEQLTNDKLLTILSSPGLSDKDKLEELEAVGKDSTNDNYTVYLIPVSAVEEEKTDHLIKEENTVVASVVEEPEKEVKL